MTTFLNIVTATSLGLYLSNLGLTYVTKEYWIIFALVGVIIFLSYLDGYVAALKSSK